MGNRLYAPSWKGVLSSFISKNKRDGISTNNQSGNIGEMRRYLWHDNKPENGLP
jgi:hypothetical protein